MSDHITIDDLISQLEQIRSGYGNIEVKMEVGDGGVYCIDDIESILTDDGEIYVYLMNHCRF